MQDTVIYIRGPFPPAPHAASPETLLQDAKAVLRLDSANVDLLGQALVAYPGFMDRTAVERIFGNYVPDQELAGALTSFVTQVNDFLRALNQDISVLISLFETWLANEENREKRTITEEEFRELKRRLAILLRPTPGFVRQAKAIRVSEAIGHPLERIELICDLRPVFDDNREVVEGMIPVTTLRVVCKGVDGLPVSLEAILSEKDVDGLARAASNAKKKLDKLRQLLEGIRLPVPTIDLTQRSEQGVHNENK